MSHSYRSILGIAVFLVLVTAVVLPLSNANADGRSVAAIESSGKLKVGVDIPYGVMEFYDEAGKPAGIDIDIAREIASSLGVEPDFMVMPFDDLFGAIDDASVDIVISAVTITPERQTKMRFSVPYLSASTVLAVSATNDTINKIEDVKGRKLGVLKGTLGAELAQTSDKLVGAEIVEFTNNDDRIAALTAGGIDAAIVHFLVKTDLPIRIVGEPLRQNFYGVVSRLDSEDLIKAVNETLRDMKRDGRLDQIKGKYIN